MLNGRPLFGIRRETLAEPELAPPPPPLPPLHDDDDDNDALTSMGIVRVFVVGVLLALKRWGGGLCEVIGGRW